MGRPKLPPHRIKHGDHSGVHWHFYHNVPICSLCLEFRRKYDRERKMLGRKRMTVLRQMLNYRDLPEKYHVEPTPEDLRTVLESVQRRLNEL